MTTPTKKQDGECKHKYHDYFLVCYLCGKDMTVKLKDLIITESKEEKCYCDDILFPHKHTGKCYPFKDDQKQSESWADEYPLNTFQGETKKELVEFVKREISKAVQADRDRIKGVLENVQEEVRRVRLDVNVIVCDCGEKYKDSDLDLSVGDLEEALSLAISKI